MTGPLYALGRFCARHHYPVIALWVIAALALVLFAQASGDKTNDNLTPSFVLNGNPVVKEFGVGLAVAIAIDATIVRCLLVPALMALLGDRAWWLPPSLEKIVPRISIEGEEYFARRDAAATRTETEPVAES